ncbi:MAG: uncharacterized protein JWN73_4956 [Betaproteobacteria bacterium]|nr:uncharacterized protein [Betaproteobacteria bacterium]
MREFPVILFLDFDGVLHPVGGVPERQRMGKLPLLEALLREPGLEGVGIVISSTWRVIHTAAQLRSLFAPDMRERVLGCTPQLEQHRTPHRRYEDISAWLRAHPAIREWVALDDDFHGFAPEAHARTVFTNSDTGLTPRDIDVLRARLLQAAGADA